MECNCSLVENMGASLLTSHRYLPRKHKVKENKLILLKGTVSEGFPPFLLKNSFTKRKTPGHWIFLIGHPLWEQHFADSDPSLLLVYWTYTKTQKLPEPDNKSQKNVITNCGQANDGSESRSGCELLLVLCIRIRQNNSELDRSAKLLTKLCDSCIILIWL